MSAGNKTDRMRAAMRAQQTPASLEAFLAQFAKPKAIDPRKFRVRHQDGKYFKKWEGTGWETVKRFALWTNEKAEAMALTLDDWDKAALIDLVCGFGGAVRMEAVK